ncbi:type II toxin-antitoxin system VapC family toxin [Sphingomonas sp. Y38-1Y]|uniref:type II toxin-antitoxin system VapC family toxin n=1 Tax=Sphingomonas sp. Y38-1Y TaxID=3078265 RepID=UPI0028E925D8|nr:type II toxin-antitoxin system VapC family toxin [Sphingomonas sp. Y38-1Y]
MGILALESDHKVLAERLDTDRERIVSAVALWEASVALRRIFAINLDRAREQIDAFVISCNLRMVPIAERELSLALDAYAQYGRGTPAGLNMGDCFAYGCAKAHGARLLYKGDDFARTDLS